MTEKLAAEIVKKSGIMRDTGMTSATPKPRAGEHTPGPWRVFERFSVLEIQVTPHDQAVIHWSGFDQARRQKAESSANARRIVACVNYCEGMPTEQIESSTIGHQGLQAERDLLRERERALVDVLGKLLDVTKRANIEVPMSDAPVFFAARDLLTKHGR